jgi:photosystem II stability/assembly factor-like uncharacterized protein
MQTPFLLVSLLVPAPASPAQDAAPGVTLRTDDHGRAAVAVVQAAPAARSSPQPSALSVDPAWTALGPYGGDVSDVAVQPGAGNVVLAGIAPSGGSGGGMFRSTDGGATWDEVASLAGNDVYDVEFATDGTAWAGTLDGPWKSTDGGATWTQQGLGIGLNDQTLEITLDPSLPNRLWAGVADALGSQPQNVLRSDDGGATWTNVTPPLGAVSCTGLAVDPTDSSTVFACFGGAFGGGAVWRSTNAGTTWTNVSAGLPANPMQDLFCDGTRVLVAGGLLFGSQPVGLYQSVNDGATWTPLHDGTWPLTVINDVEVDSADPNRIYVASAGAGVFRSSDGGATWGFGFGGSGGLSVNEVEVAPSGTAPVFLGASSAAVWKASAGVAFTPSSVGIGSLNAYSVVANPLDPDELAVAFQGLNDGGVYTSLDGGQTWGLEALPGTRFNTVAYAPDGVLYAVSDGPTSIAPEGVYRRDPGGWTSIGPDQGTLFESELFPLTFSASDPDLLLTAGSDFGVAGAEPTIWRSPDGGASWTKVYEGADDNEDVMALAIVPDGTDQTVVAAYRDLGAVQDGGALRSTDGGQSWIDSSTGLPSGAQGRGLAAPAYLPGLVYLADDDFGAGGIYRSLDGGQTWSSTGYVGQTLAVFTDPLRPARLFLAQGFSAPKAKRSVDAGATFQPYDDGLAAAGPVNGASFDAGDCGRMLFATGTGAYARVVSCPLEGDVETVSLASGGTQALDLAWGPEGVGATYWVVGSVSGTSPGTTVAGLHVPLNFDFYFQLALIQPNQVPLVASLATLDAAGQGAAAFVVPLGVDPAFVGVTFHHAYAVFQTSPALAVLGASNAVAVTIAP